MKTKFLLVVCLSVLLFQCTEEKNMKSPLWGVDFSTESTISLAQGSLDQQNAESKVTYVVSAASLRQSKDHFYNIDFTFENGETLKLSITKKTADFNYHFPGTETENQLISAVFNGNALDLKASSIAIQPDQGENKLHIIADMHTMNAGDFNGTLSRVPLIK
jgi:hypothetical protein